MNRETRNYLILSLINQFIFFIDSSKFEEFELIKAKIEKLLNEKVE